MKVDFSREITNLAGEPLVTATGDKLTLGKACMDALTVGYEDEKGLSGEEKIKRLDLALAIYASNGSTEITPEQAVLLKTLVNKGFSSPLVVGPVWKMLDSS